MPQTNFNNDHVRHELKNFKGTSNLVQNTPKLETVGVNTQTPNHMHMEYTQTPDHWYIQTTPLNLSAKYVNTQTSDLPSLETVPLLNFQSNIARNLQQSEYMHEIEYNQNPGFNP